MKYNRRVLNNGLRIITVSMPSLESATTLVMVGAGSRYENKKNNGISHFLEHMAFKGTTKRPTAMDIASLIDGIGGEFNAFTSKETTGYYIKAGKSHIALMLDVLSDMLQNSKLDPVEIDKERGVIIEEINLYEDMPMRKIGDLYENLLYDDTPLGWDISGKKENIMNITRKDFLEYLGSLYSADNMTVVIAGGIDEEKVYQDVEKFFGTMPKFKTKSFEPVEEIQINPNILVKEKKTEQVHIAIGVRTVDENSPLRYPLAVLSAILGGGMSSRLFNEVREKRGLAYYIRSHSDHYQDAGSLVSFAGIDPKRIIDAIQVIIDEYRKVSLGKMKITKEELNKAKEYLKGHLVLELEDSKSVAGYYAHQELLEKKILNPEEVLKKIDEIKAEDVEDVGKKFFINEGLNLALIGDFSDGQKLESLVKL